MGASEGFQQLRLWFSDTLQQDYEVIRPIVFIRELLMRAYSGLNGSSSMTRQARTIKMIVLGTAYWLYLTEERWDRRVFYPSVLAPSSCSYRPPLWSCTARSRSAMNSVTSSFSLRGAKNSAATCRTAPSEFSFAQ